MYNPSLLTKLQKALNPVYGNTLLIEDNRKYDEFFCKECRTRVYEDQYNSKHSVCFSCFYKEGDND